MFIFTKLLNYFPSSRTILYYHQMWQTIRDTQLNKAQLASNLSLLQLLLYTVTNWIHSHGTWTSLSGQGEITEVVLEVGSENCLAENSVTRGTWNIVWRWKAVAISRHFPGLKGFFPLWRGMAKGWPEWGPLKYGAQETTPCQGPRTVLFLSLSIQILTIFKTHRKSSLLLHLPSLWQFCLSLSSRLFLFTFVCIYHFPNLSISFWVHHCVLFFLHMSSKVLCTQQLVKMLVEWSAAGCWLVFLSS